MRVAAQRPRPARGWVSCLVAVALAVVACSGPPPRSTTPTATPGVTTSPPAAGSRDPGGLDWPTYHHDNARTGVAPGVPPVTAVRRGWTARLDGAVYGQPLIVGDTVLAATENDTVYALAATTGAIRWSRHLGTPVPRSALPCGNIDPLGITSTMAYDRATGLVFALAETTGGEHTLLGLDARTGTVRLRRAAEPPRGDRIAHQQRPALTVLQGRVYIAYGGLLGDCGNYVGTVLAVPTTGAGPILSYTVPTVREGGIWAPGGAVVHGGRLFYSVGNSASTTEYDGGDAVLALTATLHLADRFAPSVWPDDNAKDLDLGSMSPAIVADNLVIAGKRGALYVLSTSHLGGIGGQLAQADTCPAFGGGAVSDDVVYLPCRRGTAAVRIDPAGQPDLLWRARVPANGSPVLGGGAVWVTDWTAGRLYLLDPATGAVRHRLDIGALPHFASPSLSGARGYLGTMTGVTSIEVG